MNMSAQEDNETRIGAWIVGGIVAIVVVGVVGYAVSSGGKATAVADASTELSGAAAITTGDAQTHGSAHEADTMVEHAEHATSTASDGVAAIGDAAGQIYFGSGKTTIAADQKAALMAAVTALKAAPTAHAVLSGFHDSTGSLEVNQRVAKERAMAVRDGLVAQGIEASRIRMEKPQVMLGGADPQEARRVDILLAK
jgi:K(+)-stimulated pyrophosphate-energized sodium pump